MKAWIEWHWADFKALAKQDRYFKCDSCKPGVQRVRRCHEDKWDHEGGIFPIKITDFSDGFGFCPAKIFRDDFEFALNAQHLFLAWKLGQVPFADTVDTMPQDHADALMTLIQGWSTIEKAEDFRKLSVLLSGTKGDKTQWQ